MNAPILVTTCTKSKSIGSQAFIPHEHPLFKTQEDLLKYWTDTINKVPTDKKVRARELYTGRSFKRALMATDEDITNLYIISAGLGLISAERQVPPYDLTTSSAAPNRVSKQIAFGGFSPGDWWVGLNANLNSRKYPISDLVHDNPTRTIVLCLSKEYLKMILDDINTLSSTEVLRVRVIGSDLDELLPISMFPVFMPYDLRMNSSEDAMPGSRIDFSIRAAIHFITNVLPTASSLEAQKDLIRSTMDQVADTSPDEGQSRSVTDEELINIVMTDWATYRGRRVMHLRALREVHHVRCSQQRFDKLYPIIKERLAGTTPTSTPVETETETPTV